MKTITTLTIIISAALGFAACAASKSETVMSSNQNSSPTLSPVENERKRNRAVIEDFFAKLEAMDIAGFVNLFDEYGVQEMPYSPAGFPKKLEGRAAINKQYGGLPQNYNSMKFTNRVWHESVDPNKFVVEYHGLIDVKNGKPYNNDYIGVFELKGGKITRYVEYFNPIILQEAFGKDLNKNFNAENK